MSLNKVKALLIPILMFSFAAHAQDDEIVFKIHKVQTPSLYPDTIHCLDWDHKYHFVLRGIEPSAIAFISAGTGRIFRYDSIITLSLNSGRKSFVDSCMLTVHFKSSAHVDSDYISRKFYIAPDLRPQPVYVNRNNGKRGLYIRWANGTIKHTQIINDYQAPVMHYVPKKVLTGLSDPSLRFQNYSCKDTTLKSFDSIYVVLTINKKIHRYHLRCSSFAPELMDAIETMKNGDQIRLKLYYKDLETDTEKRKNIYFKLASFKHEHAIT